MTVSNQPWFYWELPPGERELAHEAAMEEEGYVANDINWGRSLVAQGQDYESCPVLKVSGPEPSPNELTDFSDPIAAILQAAIYAGLDPDCVLNRARSTQQGVLSDSVRAALHREREAGS